MHMLSQCVAKQQHNKTRLICKVQYAYGLFCIHEDILAALQYVNYWRLKRSFLPSGCVLIIALDLS